VVNILAIETSCDETSAAVVTDGRLVRANVISTQIPVHQKFGGVVPEIASRKHLENISWVVDQALSEADMALADLDAVAVTYGPGLVGALLVGVSFAKALAFAAGKPLIGVHHLEGHIAAAFLDNPELDFPVIALVVSGGHTSLIRIDGLGRYRLLGQTRDDAAGEAFDKVARSLGLGYPGGPLVEAAARGGERGKIVFPQAWLEEGSLDFSFSGLKSSVLNYLNQSGMKGTAVSVPDVADGFQEAIVQVLAGKTIKAAKSQAVANIVLAGGVAANSRLRQLLTEMAQLEGMSVVWPAPVLCTDNAAMIGCAAHHKFLAGQWADLSLNAVPYLPLFQADSRG